MQGFRKLAFVAALAAALAPAANAQVHATFTYPGLAWGFSTSHAGFSQCGTLTLDATGDFNNSDDYSMYGRLACPAAGGSYATVGNAYFDSSNNFHMTVTLSVTHKLVCDNLPGNTLGGSCPIYDNLGNQTGFAIINIL
jgi:hypothetical protein